MVFTRFATVYKGPLPLAPTVYPGSTLVDEREFQSRSSEQTVNVVYLWTLSVSPYCRKLAEDLYKNSPHAI